MSAAKTIAAEVERPAAGQTRARRRIFASLPLKKVTLCLGDLAVINIALFLALMLRDVWLPESHGVTKHFLVWNHFFAFNILHGVWLFVFYSVGLYDIERFDSRWGLVRKIALGVVICGVIGLVLFYTASYLKITPKMFRIPPRSALALDLTFLSVLLYASRELFLRWGRNGSRVQLLLCGNGTEVNQFRQFLDRNPHLGYHVRELIPMENADDGELSAVQELLHQRLLKEQVDVIVMTRTVSENEKMRAFSYKLLCSGANVVDFCHLYEEVTGKVPSSLIDEGWFVDNVKVFNRRGSEIAKRSLDVIGTVVLGFMTLVLSPVVAIAIKLDSPGPVIFQQGRVGRDGRIFSMLKFRTMECAGNNRAEWAGQAERRITRVGRFLRKTRIDELPQLWNVLKGDMSFVGPRPEWTELYAELTQQIHFYDARALVRPGLTGWAQINFGYGASVEDDREKLQYDLYYVKNRSMALDLSILLKTVSTILRYEGR